MKKEKQKIKIRIQKTILFLGIIIGAKTGYAQIYADFQVNGANDSCIGCNVISPMNAVDGNTETYATLNLKVAKQGANVYQTLNFSVTGNAGDYVGLAVEDTNFMLLDADVLRGTELTTYYNTNSNNDTKVSSQFTITRINDVDYKYLIEFQTTSPFDAIELKLNAGISGTSNNLMVFYAYHSVEPMPVNLLSFNAAAEENTVTINWATASEINNNYFTIERSKDGQNFEELKKIKGAGNTILKKEYSFTDAEPLPGVSYYRLKQTDYNGKFEYFKTVQVNFKTKPFDLEIYPNPARSGNALNIHIAEKAVLNIVDAEGKIVFTKNLLYEENMGDVKIELGRPVEQGIYSVIIISDDKTRIKKWLVIN